MFLAPDGDEIEISNAAATFFADAMPIERLHAPHSADLSPALRQQFAEMGWFALALPEENGGTGLSAVELALFFRECGRQCGPVDVLAQALAVMLPLDAAVRDSLLAGEAAVALALDEAGGLRLLGAPDATYALLVKPDGAKLIALPGGGEERPPLDPAGSMRLLQDVPAHTVAELSGDHIWLLGALATAAMLVGIAENALSMIVEYAKIRETFGRKIGAYQAVRHPCADMALRLEAARCQLWYAAAALKEERGDAAIHVDAAKHLSNQAGVTNADVNIQLHGGIGVTDEHNAHLLLKHAMVLSKLFGSKRTLLARLLHAKAA